MVCVESDNAARAALADRVSRPVSGGPDSVSRASGGSSEKASRDTSGFLLVRNGSGHFDLADLKLPVEMGKLAAGVFE